MYSSLKKIANQWKEAGDVTDFFSFLNKNLFGSWLGGLSTFHVEIFSIKLGLSQIPESYANESSFGGRKLIDEEGMADWRNERPLKLCSKRSGFDFVYHRTLGCDIFRKS